jgi:hypothetical protein
MYYIFITMVNGLKFFKTDLRETRLEGVDWICVA